MPAGSRPIWKGQIRLSLVSIPVELYTATKPNAKPTFHQIHRPTGKRVNYEKVVQGIGPVDKDEIMKGFEYEKGDYVLLSEEEIGAVKLETKKTLELTQFVDAHEVDPIYYDKPYYIVPADELAEDAFRVLRDALRETGKIGLGQLAMRGQEYVCAIKPTGTGLLLETLHYEDEIRKSDSFFSELGAGKAEEDLLDVAKALIQKKTGKFDAGVFKDHYHAALRELIAEKLKSKGKPIAPAADNDERPTGSNVIDLMAALKKSLEGGGGGTEAKPAAKKPATKSTSKTAAKDEGDKAAPAKKPARPAAKKPAAKTEAAAKPAAKPSARKKAS